MDKEIALNKKIIVILLLINIIIIGVSSSYALFQTSVIQNNIVKISSGTTDIETIIDNYSDNLITLASGETKTLNITLTNESSDYDILYKMYYTVESGEGLILVTDTTSDTSGIMKGEKSLSLTIQNNNASDLSIIIGTIGSLLTEEIILLDGQYELIGDTEPPIISNISDAGEGKITFTVSDTGSGVDKYCVNQSDDDTTGCNWITAVEGEQTTDVITSENGNYYVHVRDLAGNIGHSGVVSVSLNYTASTFATEKYGTGGLVAINTSGTLYNGTGTIREYRYSGATVNNYVEFNNGEMWRIIGIFKNSSGEWNLKLMRNTVLTSAELPSTYTYNGIQYEIEQNYPYPGRIYYYHWSYTNNDWAKIGLQYWLNGNDGYFGTLVTKAQNMVDRSYTYHLGNVTNYDDSKADTTITSYINERGTTICSSAVIEYTQNYNCNIWYGYEINWSGSIALMYPSDYGYSASSSYWSGTTLKNYGNSARNTSWIYKTAERTHHEWMLPSSSYNSKSVAYLGYGGAIADMLVSGTYTTVEARPVLNLLASAPIDANHTGSSSDPYVVLE